MLIVLRRLAPKFTIDAGLYRALTLIVVQSVLVHRRKTLSHYIISLVHVLSSCNIIVGLASYYTCRGISKMADVI